MANKEMINRSIAETLDRLIDRFGVEYVIRQAAEECMELAQALLKYVRAYNGEVTPVSPADALDHIVEELSDVTLMNSMVTSALALNMENMYEIMQQKINRCNDRLDAIAMDSGGDVVQCSHETKED